MVCDIKSQPQNFKAFLYFTKKYISRLKIQLILQNFFYVQNTLPVFAFVTIELGKKQSQYSFTLLPCKVRNINVFFQSCPRFSFFEIIEHTVCTRVPLVKGPDFWIVAPTSVCCEHPLLICLLGIFTILTST